MKFCFALILLASASNAVAQEVISCDGTSSPAVCASSSGLSIVTPLIAGQGKSVPVKLNNPGEKILIPSSAGQAVTLTTLPGSQPSNYWVQISNSNAVDFNGDLSTKLKTSALTETAQDSSNIVLTGGMLNTVTLNLSGYSGQSAKSFSAECAIDIQAGVFGEASLAYFIARRKQDLNAPKLNCDTTDIQWLESNAQSYSKFCPAGTTPLPQDNANNPAFTVQRLAPKNKCKLQADGRACSIVGDQFKCTLSISNPIVGNYREGTGIYGSVFADFTGISSILLPLIFLPGNEFTPQGQNNFASQSISSASSAAGHLVSVISETTSPNSAACTFFFGRNVGCKAYYEIVTHKVTVSIDDSQFFYPLGGDQNQAISNQCSPWIDSKTDVTYNYPGYQLKNQDASFGLNRIQSLNLGLLCPSYAQQSYNIVDYPSTASNYGRNILSITSEANMTSARQYQYVNDSCPTGQTLESTDQYHFNSTWTETDNCTLSSCPSANLYYQKLTLPYQTMVLNRGQPGANHGSAAVFAYDIKSVNITSNPGHDGSSGAVDIQNPTTTKYCAQVKDFSNAVDVHDVQSVRPSVTLDQVNFSAYQTSLPDPVPVRIYDTSSTPYVFKRIDSSVRDWLMHITDN